MKILFITAICLLALSLILYVSYRTVSCVRSLNLFKKLLYEKDVCHENDDDYLSMLIVNSLLDQFQLSEFDYCFVCAGVHPLSSVEKLLKSHGLKTGVIGGVALFAFYSNLSFFGTFFLGFLVSRIGVWYLNVMLGFFARFFYHSRAKRIYRKFKSPSVD